MTNKTKLAIVAALLLWASGFVGIRAGLQGYSPEGLALLRYLVASLCMGFFYFRMPDRKDMRMRDAVLLMGLGVIGIGIYNITLNYGELFISSGIASFITSQAPIIATIIAILFLGEKINFYSAVGFFISFLGVALIAVNEGNHFHWNHGVFYVLIAALSAGLYVVLQKPFLKRYHAIEVTTYLIWGAALFLCIYAPELRHDFKHANWPVTLTVIYLGIFPAAIAYLAWSYVLSEISVSQASSFLYFMPFITTLLGWLCLKEVPMLISFFGGMIAVSGVWVVNYSFRQAKNS